MGGVGVARAGRRLGPISRSAQRVFRDTVVTASNYSSTTRRGERVSDMQAVDEAVLKLRPDWGIYVMIETRIR